MRTLVLLFLLTGFAAPVAAQPFVGVPPQQDIEERMVPDPAGIGIAVWAQGLEAPWSLVFLPDGRALVSERPGRIRVIERGLRPEPLALVESQQGGEGGLMGLALHPRFPDPPFLYAMHTFRAGGQTTNRVIRLIVEGTSARFDKVIVRGIPGARNHNGGRIAFGPDGHLYVGTGEIFQAELAQDPSSLAGKVLRVDADGGIPANNPFPGSPVYSLGHRNVQGLAWHPSGALFASEHGPSGELGLRAWDEMNVVRAGGNYGWPRVVGAANRPPFVDPLVAWRDSATPPSGIAFWGNELFVATLRSQALIRLRVEEKDGQWRVTDIERWFARNRTDGVHGRLRDVVVGPDGALYVLTNNQDGRGRPQPGDDRILRLTTAVVGRSR